MEIIPTKQYKTIAYPSSIQISVNAPIDEAHIERYDRFVNSYSSQSRFATMAHGSLWRLLFAALLLIALPVFIWATATQRIELRKKAATSEPPIVCWNRVGGNGSNLYWPDGCKGAPQNPEAKICTQATIPLTPSEQYQYGQWVNAGKPYIPGCMPTPTPVKTINWSTPHVTFVAEDLTIMANGKTFKGIPDPGTSVNVTSDPGNNEYTTLEAIWREQGVEMRLFMYFYATNVVPSGFSGNGPYWGTSEIRTYNGNNPGDWIYYTNRTVMGRIGSPGPEGISFTSPNGNGQLIIKNLKLQAFLQHIPSQPKDSCFGAREGASCTINTCPTVTCTPGQPCARPVCKLQNGVCQNGACVPTATPTPPPGCYYQQVQCFQAPCNPIVVCTSTPTVTPTKSPTPTPTPSQPPSSQTMTLRIKLAGVTGAEANGAKVGVKFVQQNGSTLQLSAPLALTHVGSGVYQTSAVITNPFVAGTKFRVKLKGEKHVAIEFCRQTGQTVQCADSEFITMPNPTPSAFTMDFTGIALPPGDLSVQDGRADINDLNKLNPLMAKICSSLTTAEKLVGDLNYDGCVTVRDVFLLLQTLETRYDE